MWPVKTILHPTDFTESSEETHRVACQLARDRQARLIALHVTPKAVVKHVEGHSELPPAQAREKLWEAMRQPRPEEAGLLVEHRLEEGDPVPAILRAAEQTGCELIVMGMHHRTGLTRWFAAGVADEVIRKAPCSVLIVKAPVVAPQPAPTAEIEEPSAAMATPY